MKKWILGIFILVSAGVGGVGAEWKINREGQVVWNETGSVLSSDSGTTKDEVSDLEEIGLGEESELSELESEIEGETAEGPQWQVKIENDDDDSDMLELTVEDLEGREEWMDEQELLEIEDEWGVIQVKAGEGGGIELAQGSLEVKTELTVTVQAGSREFWVDTPGGRVKLGVMPEEAVALLLARGVVSEFRRGVSGVEVELEWRDGKLVYELDGQSGQKFLGLVPVTLSRRVRVSAEDGRVVGLEQGWRQGLLDRLSY